MSAGVLMSVVSLASIAFPSAELDSFIGLLESGVGLVKRAL